MKNKKIKCYLCSSKKYFERPGKVRDIPQLKIFECISCGLVYLSSFKHIKKKHYEESGMHQGNNVNTEKWLKETESDDRRRYSFLKQKITDKSLLDFGCGIGGFIVKSQKISKDVSGVELEKALFKSFKDRKLNISSNLKTFKTKKFDVITSFHVFEHLKDPIKVLKNLSKLLKKNGEIILEVPNSNDVLITLYENNNFQKFTYWSKHLYIFNEATIKKLVYKSGLKMKWIKHIQRYPLSNHLYWLSKGKPGGHKLWNFLENNKLKKEYEKQLSLIKMTDTIIVGISL